MLRRVTFSAVAWVHLVLYRCAGKRLAGWFYVRVGSPLLDRVGVLRGSEKLRANSLPIANSDLAVNSLPIANSDLAVNSLPIANSDFRGGRS